LRKAGAAGSRAGFCFGGEESRMSFTVERLSPDLPFGITIRGLRRSHLSDEGVRERLRQHWVNDGLVVLRDGDCDEAYHLELSKVFGPLAPHPVKEVMSKGNPELIDVIGEPNNSIIVEVGGVTGTSYLGWHKDLVYMDRINHGGILRAIRPTKHGGVTGYLDQITAYETLPAALKERIQNLSVVYRMGRWDEMRFGAPTPIRLIKNSPQIEGAYARLDKDFLPVAHPMVFVQPETGRKALNISPFFALHVHEMNNAAGDALLKELCDHIHRCPSYHHTWSTTELVLWDNWRMLHSVTPVPLDENRLLQRTTIKGDYGIGQKLGLEAARSWAAA
jgi:taurine dioxygenase